MSGLDVAGAPEHADGDHSPRVVEYGPLTLTLRGRTAQVRFTRHAKRNAVSADVADAFAAANEELAARGVIVATLTAEGTMFSAGADMSSHTPPGEAAPTDKVIDLLRASPLFWICGLQGGAAGAGAAIALSCPVVVAAPEAWLWLPELSKINRLPVGVLRSLSGLIGTRDAFALAVGEERVSAARALDAGWIGAVVPADQLVQTVDDYASRLSRADEGSVRAAVTLWRERTT
jgi:enoyl-CoA hydratase/carnithine racemase